MTLADWANVGAVAASAATVVGVGFGIWQVIAWKRQRLIDRRSDVAARTLTVVLSACSTLHSMCESAAVVIGAMRTAPDDPPLVASITQYFQQRATAAVDSAASAESMLREARLAASVHFREEIVPLIAAEAAFFNVCRDLDTLRSLVRDEGRTERTITLMNTILHDRSIQVAEIQRDAVARLGPIANWK